MIGLLLSVVALGFPATALAEQTSVLVADDFFDDEILRVPVGTTVSWDHKGLLRHTITADDGSFHSGDLERGERFTRRFDKAGVFAYFCAYHGAPRGRGMHGLVLAGDAQIPPQAPLAEARPEGAVTLRVPQEFASIQSAVDAARPRDLILIHPGIYEEAVIVATPEIVVRGTDRSSVILDGGFTRPNGFLVSADGVAIENLTARRYLVNGFYWWHVDGYRGSYLTATNNGDYGLYAINSRHGLFDHVYAAGSPDSGIYIGGCQPCDAVIVDSLAEYNALGYSGTNAGGNLYIARSEWRNNFSGIVPNTLDSEKNAPQRGAVVAGNYVHDNGDPRAASKGPQYASFGGGILVAGGEDNLVVRNLVENNSSYGIAALPNLDLRFWMPVDNEIRENQVSNSGRSDLALGGPAGGGNCFSANDYATSLPPAIEGYYGCESILSRLGGGDIGVVAERLALFARGMSDRFPRGDWKTAPSPGAPAQPQMPEAVFAPAIPAVNEPSIRIDPNVIGLPLRSPAEGGDKEVLIMGTNAAPTPLVLALGLYAYALPLALYATWVSISVWDIARREDLGGGGRVWSAALVLILPVFGPAGYLLFAKSSIPRGLRTFLVLGGLALYVALAALSFLGLAA